MNCQHFVSTIAGHGADRYKRADNDSGDPPFGAQTATSPRVGRTVRRSHLVGVVTWRVLDDPAPPQLAVPPMSWNAIAAVDRDTGTVGVFDGDGNQVDALDAGITVDRVLPMSPRCSPSTTMPAKPYSST